jgi:hypothetical protein
MKRQRRFRVGRHRVERQRRDREGKERGESKGERGEDIPLRVTTMERQSGVR